MGADPRTQRNAESHLNLDAAIEDFRAYLRDEQVGDSSIAVFGRIVARFLDAQNQDDLSKIKPKHVEAWLAERITRRTPRGTANVLVSAMRRFASWPATAFAVSDVRWPKTTGLPERFRDALPIDQLDQLFRALDAVPEPTRTVLELLPHTGLRISEACALRHTDVKPMRGRDGKMHAGLEVLGKGQKVRWVPLSPDAQTVLEDAGNHHGHGRSPWLFPSPTNPRGRSASGHITPGAVRFHARGLAQVLGIPFTPHTLRHTWATQALADGAPLEIVQRILGHTKIETTQRYLHPGADALSAAVGAVDFKKK
jgi:integrase/recombinase XerD